MTQFVEVMIGGLTLSAVYFLIASGVTVVFGQTRIVNFAHGQFLIIGGLISWSCVEAGIPYIPAVAIAVLAVAALTLVIERTILRDVAENPLGAFIITLGLLIVLQQLCVEIWGPESHQLSPPLLGNWSIGDVVIPYTTPALIVPAVLIGAAMVALFSWSDAGRQARACAEDAYAAAHLGVRVNRVSSVVFVGATALAALAGGLIAMVYPINMFDGGGYVLKGFSIALVGGLGSIGGAAFAAVAFGLIEAYGQAYWLPQWVPMLSFALIILTLLIRPTGLFGKSTLSTESVVSMISRHIPAPRWAPIALVVIALFSFIFLPSMLSIATLGIAAIAMVNSAQAAAVGALFRLSGVLSFAHGALFGIGGFFAAYAAIQWGIGFWAAIPLAFILCGILGAVIAMPLFRTRGLYFLIVAFAVTDAVALIELNWNAVTNGSSGLSVLEPPGGVLGFGFETPEAMFRLMLALVAAITVVCWLIGRSGFGDRLLAIRDNEVLARSLGLPVKRYLVLWFGVTSGLSGIAGVMFLYESLAVAPALFTGLATVTFPIMVIIGGSRSLVGPIVGAVFLTFLPTWLDIGAGTNVIVYGVILIVVMLMLPQGIVPSLYQVIGALTRRLGGGRPAAVKTETGKPQLDERADAVSA